MLLSVPSKTILTHHSSTSPACCRLLTWLILHPWRWRWHVPPKCRLAYNGLHGAISQKTLKCTYILCAATTKSGLVESDVMTLQTRPSAALHSTGSSSDRCSFLVSQAWVDSIWLVCPQSMAYRPAYNVLREGSVLTLEPRTDLRIWFRYQCAYTRSSGKNWSPTFLSLYIDQSNALRSILNSHRIHEHLQMNTVLGETPNT
jgi:hypothetical protein